MKDFVLDSTYMDTTIVNSNDDIFITSSNNIPNNSITHHTINLNTTSPNYMAHYDRNNKYNAYSVVDYL